MRFDNNTSSPPEVGTSEKKTIHNVIILDRSGSMRGSKYDIAVSSINEELNLLKKDDAVNYTNTVIEFDDFGSDVVHYYKQPLSSFKDFKGKGARGLTALYDCLGTTLEKLIKEVIEGKDERVLVKIFTDGGENASRGKYSNAYALKEVLDQAQAKHKFTVTFIGTEQDVESMINSIGIDRGNTVSHDNTIETVTRAVKLRTSATMNYAKAVASGASAETLTTNFFKGLKND